MGQIIAYVKSKKSTLGFLKCITNKYIQFWNDFEAFALVLRSRHLVTLRIDEFNSSVD